MRTEIMQGSFLEDARSFPNPWGRQESGEVHGDSAKQNCWREACLSTHLPWVRQAVSLGQACGTRVRHGRLGES